MQITATIYGEAKVYLEEYMDLSVKMSTGKS